MRTFSGRVGDAVRDQGSDQRIEEGERDPGATCHVRQLELAAGERSTEQGCVQNDKQGTTPTRQPCGSVDRGPSLDAVADNGDL
jgi:chitodextrinase